MFSTFFMGALYLEHVLGYSPAQAGSGLHAGDHRDGRHVGRSTTASLVNRYGKKVMYPAMVSAAAGLLLLASAGQGASYFPTICFAFLLLGVGGGASFMPLLQIGMSEIPKDDAEVSARASSMSPGGSPPPWAWPSSAQSPRLRTHSQLAGGQTAIHSLTAGYQLALVLAAASVLLGLALAPILLRTRETPRRGAAAHRGEHAEPRGDGAPGPLVT